MIAFKNFFPITQVLTFLDLKWQQAFRKKIYKKEKENPSIKQEAGPVSSV